MMKWHVDKQLYMRIRLEDSDITIGPDHTSKGDLFMLIADRVFVDDGKCIQVLKHKGESLLLKQREEAETYLQTQKAMRKTLSDACKETTKNISNKVTFTEIIKNFFKG